MALRISTTGKVWVCWVCVPVQNENKCQIAVKSYAIEMLSLTGSLDCNGRWPLAENILKVSTEMTEHDCYWCLWFQKQQCNQVANQQAINSCFLKGEKGLEKRDMRSLPWSILSQQVKWESLLWSQDHLPPEMLTGLMLRLVHWSNTHWGRDRGDCSWTPASRQPVSFVVTLEPRLPLLI